MTNREMEQRHLAQATRHVAELEDKIARQGVVVAELNQYGHDTILALQLLNVFKDLLITAREHESLIVKQLNRLDGWGPAQAS